MYEQARHWNRLASEVKKRNYKHRILSETKLDTSTLMAVEIIDSADMPIVSFEILIYEVDEKFSPYSSEDLYNVVAHDLDRAAELICTLVKTPWSRVDDNHQWVLPVLKRSFALCGTVSTLFLQFNFEVIGLFRSPGLYVFFPVETLPRMKLKTVDDNELKKISATLKEIKMHGFQLRFKGDQGGINCERTTAYIDKATNTILLPRGGSSGPPIALRLEQNTMTFDFNYKSTFELYRKETNGQLGTLTRFFNGFTAGAHELRAIWSKDFSHPDSYATIANAVDVEAAPNEAAH